ncbi:Crp/Fnr family transcriptional regulator [Actimicrobium sp. GrIS 1.19]|uniref:Crp/Fnr family transcriptional regulator n=1 Tax=Actimicrobium sp. GrIS 1.19 TaxID=3071708 RepID=UPI002E0EDE4F
MAKLPVAEYVELARGLEHIELEAGCLIEQRGTPLQYVWFPNDCLISLRAEISDEAGLEVGLIGREGALSIAFGARGSAAPLTALVQVGGSAMRIEAEAFARLAGRSLGLQHAIFASMRSLMMQASQIALCSHYHLLEARLARALLLTRDRLQSNEFHLTHEFLSKALGVRRVGVTRAASTLHEKNLIHYRRGAITLADIPGLEAAACACYEIDKGLQTSPGKSY